MSDYEKLLTHGAIYQLPSGKRFSARGSGVDGVFTVWLLVPTNDDDQAFDAPRQGLWVTPMGNLGIAYIDNWPLDPPRLTCHLLHTYADGGRPMHLGDLQLVALGGNEELQSDSGSPDMDVWGEVLR